jgi:hypothetical protein
MEEVAKMLRTPTITTFDPAREVTVMFELRGQNEIVRISSEMINKKFAVRKPFRDLPYNMNDVSVTALNVRHVTNASPNERLQICKIFDPISAQQESEEMAKMYVAMGAPPGCAIDVPPKFDGPQNTFLIKESPDCLYLQHSFVKACMHVDPTNLMNGIIVVPPEICAAAQLPKVGIIFGEQGQSIDVPVDYYVLVPGKHLLAWCLDIGEHWRRLKGFHAIELTAKEEGARYAEIVYFLVGNHTFDRLRQQCIDNFLTNKVDRRRLTDVGVRFIGTGTATLSMTFIAYPQMTPEMKAQLFPMLPPDFPLFRDVISREVEARRVKLENTQKPN